MTDENELEELRTLESQIQSFLAQKQTIQIELNEIENALAELKTANDEVYKIISGVMLRSDKQKISEELKEKKKSIEMHIGSLEKQEKLLEKRSSALKKEIIKSRMKNQ